MIDFHCFHAREPLRIFLSCRWSGCLEHDELSKFLQLMMIFLSWSWAWRGSWADDRTGRLREWALTVLWTDPAFFELPNAIAHFMSMSSGTRNFLSWWWSSCLEEHDFWEFRELMVIRLSWGAWALRVSWTDDLNVLSKSVSWVDETRLS